MHPWTFFSCCLAASAVCGESTIPLTSHIMTRGSLRLLSQCHSSPSQSNPRQPLTPDHDVVPIGQWDCGLAADGGGRRTAAKKLPRVHLFLAKRQAMGRAGLQRVTAVLTCSQNGHRLSGGQCACKEISTNQADDGQAFAIFKASESW